MNKLFAILACTALFLTACDNKSQNAENKDDNVPLIQPVVEEYTVDKASLKEPENNNIWNNIKDEPENFAKAFAELNDVQKYYFCASFSVGAMSVSKPATASAMVNYFIGLGVARYNQGIEEATYNAFDAGKRVFRYELVVDDILNKKICENIIVEATEFAKEHNYTTETLNDMGAKEVEKNILPRLKK